MAKLGLLRKKMHRNIEINKILATRPIVQNCQLKKDD